MKQLLTALSLILFIACQEGRINNSVQSTESNYSNFDWLLGSWKRVNGDTTLKTFEVWHKGSKDKYLGHGYILAGMDTVWQEKMELVKDSSDWLFVVKTIDNSETVTFQLNSSSKNAFTVGNPEHDFPKQIKYWHNQEKLFAEIKGDTVKIKFEFERNVIK